MSNRNQKLRQVVNALDLLSGIFADCTARELRDLKKKIEGLSSTNCGYYTYWARPLLLRTAIEERRFRKPKPRKSPTEPATKGKL